MTEAAASPVTAPPPVPPPLPVAVPVHGDAAEASRWCQQWVESGVTSNASIRFLLQTLVDAGCAPPTNFIRCAQCAQPQAGGFGLVVEERVAAAAVTTAKPKSDPANHETTKASVMAAANEQCQRTTSEVREQFRRSREGTSHLRLQPEIFVCQQYMANERMVHQTLHHELIHAVDLCRTRMDPLRNCVHLACTEIRAENLSGECAFWKELPRMSSFARHGQDCVRRRAILSVRANPHCTARAADYVDAALPRCFQDYYPYDRHPNQR